MSFSAVASSSPRRSYIGYALLPDVPPPPSACYQSKVIPGFVDAIGFGNDAIGVASPVLYQPGFESFAVVSGNEGSDYVKVQIFNDVHPPVQVGSVRGEISQFSRESRKRMLDTLCQLRSDAILPQFLTLTYPKQFPHESSEWKRHLDNFWKRIVRLYPQASAVWKLEPQDRCAPHYHLLVYGLPFTRVFKRLVSRIWYDVVGSGDSKHLRAGTEIEPIRSLRGVKAYASKRYMGKELSSDFLRVCSETVSGWVNPGRFWGVLNRAFLPVGKRFSVKLPLNDAHDVIRTARKIYKNKTGRNVYSTSNSITLFTSADIFRRILPVESKTIDGPLPPGRFYVREWLVRMQCDVRFLGRNFSDLELSELNRAVSPIAFFLSLR